MTGLVRHGGRGTLADGTLLTWSVAEGSRGRRWRATLVRDAVLHQGLLLETDLQGRPTRLEVDARDGLLTLHPAEDGHSIHGNVVTATGIRHLMLPWSDDHELFVGGQPVVAMAAAHRLRSALNAGDSIERPAVVVDEALDVRPAHVHVVRLSTDRWDVSVDGRPGEVEIAANGVPAGLADAADWPLER